MLMQLFTCIFPQGGRFAARPFGGLLLLLLVWALPQASRAQAPAWAWARNLTVAPSSASATPSLIPTRIATDASGNSYVLGHFAGIVTLGTTALTNAASTDLFVAKLDPAGNYLWTQRLGGPGTETSGSLAVDAAGDVLVAGSFSQTMTLGSFTLTASTASSQIEAYFVGKLSASGTWLWANKYGAYISRNRPPSVAAAPGGDVLLAGAFDATSATGVLAFQLGSTALVTAGGYDVYAARLDGSTGAWRWAVRAGSTAGDEAFGICADAAGNALVCGSFTGTVPFGGTSLTSAGAADAFVARLDPAGAWQWASGGGGLSNDVASAVAVDRANNPVVTGSFRGVATFGTVQTGSAQITVDDILVAKLSSAGQWQWATRAGGSSYDYGFGVALDRQDNVYVGGQVDIQADFGSTVLNPGSTRSSSAFVGRLSPAGAWQWATGAGNATSGYITLGFALDPAGNAFLTNRYQGTATIGPFVLSSGGPTQDGGYIAKLGSTPLATRAEAATQVFTLAPNPLTANGSLTVASAKAGQLEIRDALGRLVQPAVAIGAGAQAVRLPRLAPGLYLITLRTATATATQRLVVE